MVDRSGTGYNVNQCQFCQRTNADGGEWFWVTSDCDICSDCAHGRHIMVALGYRKAAANYSDGKKLYRRTADPESRHMNAGRVQRPLDLVPLRVCLTGGDQ